MPVNTYDETHAVDYLDQQRIELAKLRASDIKAGVLTIGYILQLIDNVALTDTLTNTQSSNPGTFMVNDDSSFQKFYLSFDGFDVIDSSGNSNNGTVTGTTTFAAGAITPINDISKSFSFDGSTYITIPSGGSITGTGNRTISFWVYPASFTSGARILEYGVAGTHTLFSIRFSGTAGLIDFYDGASTITSTAKLKQNNWNWVCLTIGTSGTAFNLYIHNTTVDTTQTITALNTTSSTINIGADVSNGNKIPNGCMIDEIRFYNFVTSSAERSALFDWRQISHNSSVTAPSFVQECDCA